MSEPSSVWPQSRRLFYFDCCVAVILLMFAVVRVPIGFSVQLAEKAAGSWCGPVHL
jgi:hypothetical protein